MNVLILIGVVGIVGILGSSDLGQALRFLEEPTSVVAVRNSRVSLNCTATASSTTTIFWRKDGDRILSDSNRLVKTSGHLVIRRLRGKKGALQNDEGVYQCLASNKEGIIASRKARIQLAVLSRAFKEWPKNATIWQGETARFACQAKRAIPDPVISWEKNGHKVTPGGRYVILTTGVLQILQVQKSDEGFYRCVIQNIVRQRLSVKGWLAVRQVMPPAKNPVHFAVIPGNTSAITGHQVIMECIATGLPVPTVQWKKVVHHNQDQAATLAKKGSSNLQISSVSVHDEGEYLCVISGGGKTIRQSAFLFVKVPPHFLVKPPTNDVAITGRTVILFCSASGSPLPRITWLKDGQTITISSRIIMTNNGLNRDLMISRISERDAGVYQCFAENSLGSTQSSTRVIVRRSVANPSPPQNLSVTALSESEVKVVWKAPQGSTKVLAYAVTYQPLDNSSKELQVVDKGFNVVLRDLQGFTDYSLYVTPFFTKYGRGLKSATVIVRTLEGKPTSPPTNVLLASYTPDSIDVRWIPPSKRYRHGVITNYIIRYSPKEGLTKIVQVPSIVNQKTINGLKGGKDYSFEVAAATSKGVGPFSLSKVFTVATKAHNVISAPNMSINPVNSTTLEVAWQTPTFGGNRIQQYKLSYTRDNSPIDQHGPLLNIHKDKKQFIINGLLPNTKYVVRLMAWDGKKLGQPSVDVCKTGAGTAANTRSQNAIDVKCHPYSPTSLWISWQKVFSPQNVSYYQLSYEIKGNINHNTVSTKRVTDTNTMIPSLRPGKTYRVTIKPHDSNNKEITGFVGSTVECDTPEAEPSSAPRNVKLEVKSKQSVDLTWEPPTKPNGKITNYIIAYSTNKDLPDNQWNEHKETILSKFFSRFEKFVKASLHGLTYNTTYYIKIKAGNKMGYGPFSRAIYFFMTMEKDRRSYGTLTIALKYISRSVIEISWRHPVSRRGMPVRYRAIYTNNPKLPHSEWYQVLVEVNLKSQRSERSVSVQLANLSLNQTYYVRVQADYGNQYGPWSEQRKITIHDNRHGGGLTKTNNTNTKPSATSSDSRTSTEKEDFEIKLGIIIGCVISAFCIVVLVLFIIWRCPCRFTQAKNQGSEAKKNGLANGVPNGLPNGLPNGYSVSASRQSVASNRLGQSTSYEESSGGSSIGSSVCQCRCTCSAGRWPQLSSTQTRPKNQANGHIITGNGHLVSPTQGPPQSKPYSMPLGNDKVLNGYVLQDPPVPLQVLVSQENGKVVVGTKTANSKSISVDV